MRDEEEFTVFYYLRLLREHKIAPRFVTEKVLPRLEALGLDGAKAELERATKPPSLPRF